MQGNGGRETVGMAPSPGRAPGRVGLGGGVPRGDAAHLQLLPLPGPRPGYRRGPHIADLREGLAGPRSLSPGPSPHPDLAAPDPPQRPSGPLPEEPPPGPRPDGETPPHLPPTLLPPPGHR